MTSSYLPPILAGGLFTLLSLLPVENYHAAAPRSTVIPAVVRVLGPQRIAPITHAETPHGWTSAGSQLDQSAEDFRNLTSQEIETCALALDGMVRRANRGALGSRSYLYTRLQALREHVDYARSELAKLPRSHGDENFIPAHAHFYRTIKSLEQAFAQAASELNGDI